MAFIAAWVVGLAVFGAGPAPGASDLRVAEHFALHPVSTALQAVLVHGLAAVALLGVVQAVRRAGYGTTTGYIAGAAAAALSLVQLPLELARSLVTTGQTTASVVHLVERLDGIKLLTLAVMIVATAADPRARSLLGRPMTVVGCTTAAALVLAGVGFTAGSDALTVAAAPALILLLVWVAGTGAAVDRSRRGPRST